VFEKPDVKDMRSGFLHHVHDFNGLLPCNSDCPVRAVSEDICEGVPYWRQPLFHGHWFCGHGLLLLPPH
jgi:hypothetical protein